MNSIDREMSGDLKSGFKCIGIVTFMYTVFSLLSPQWGAYSFQTLLRGDYWRGGGGLFERGGAYLFLKKII